MSWHWKYHGAPIWECEITLKVLMPGRSAREVKEQIGKRMRKVERNFFAVEKVQVTDPKMTSMYVISTWG